MWHSAQYRGDELIVLGHDPRRNDCMLVRLSGLPMNEQHDLRRIAAARSAQESTHLIPILRRMPAPDGSDWFTYLTLKMTQRNSPVFTLPIKEIQDTLDPDQKAIFKGYGKGRRNSALDRDDLAKSQSGEDDDDDNELPIREASSPKVNSSIDHKLDLLIETVADEGRRTHDLLTRLLTTLSGSQDTTKRPAKKRVIRRPTTVKKQPEPATSSVEAKVEAISYEA